MTLTDKYINPFTDFGFKKLFAAAEIANYTPAEQQEYENSLKYYRDLKNITDTAFEEGKAEGKAEGLAEGLEKGKEENTRTIALSALAEGATDTFIARITGLSASEIAALRASL